MPTVRTALCRLALRVAHECKSIPEADRKELIRLAHANLARTGKAARPDKKDASR